MSTTFTPPPSFSIPTSRLHISYLEPNNPTHSAFVHHLWNTDDFIQAEGPTGLDTPEKAAKFIATRVQSDYNRNKHGQMLVSLKPYPDASLAESKMIGMVSLMKGEPPNAYTQPDVGYTILPEESGKGYATEAGIGLIEYARRELGVEGVFGFCRVDAARSRRVLEKIGLEFRGERNLRVFGGARSAVYALPGMGGDLTVYGIDD
ncbi:putative GNAT family acetyltransferase [Aspergillus heteromorphus CBS 117.55]|uniref:Putative GNAT family acetyltransferase n=1 Tax=Aspergillus heteromorphus CBS 117.55 TaxID=1448321 RepID=A0A317X149_9EURO|nr:putative GNAT family acetyltransferase [Aspergillus heteromorphus CBS 117.55]PWY92273.1 putative GNAT family acetyltransferase [Aspergillus heteromorphus CBS 117.55]